jgi:hypothetical protein
MITIRVSEEILNKKKDSFQDGIYLMVLEIL